MGPDQLELDKIEGVRMVLVLVPLQSGLHGIIVLGAQLTVRAFRMDCDGKGRQEFVAWWEVAYNESR